MSRKLSGITQNSRKQALHATAWCRMQAGIASKRHSLEDHSKDDGVLWDVISQTLWRWITTTTTTTPRMKNTKSFKKNPNILCPSWQMLALERDPMILCRTFWLAGLWDGQQGQQIMWRSGRQSSVGELVCNLVRLRCLDLKSPGMVAYLICWSDHSCHVNVQMVYGRSGRSGGGRDIPLWNESGCAVCKQNVAVARAPTRNGTVMELAAPAAWGCRREAACCKWLDQGSPQQNKGEECLLQIDAPIRNL